MPLLVLAAIRPRARNPRGVTIDELFLAPPSTMRGLPRGGHQKEPWTTLFFALDRVLQAVEPHFPKSSRRSAIAKAVAFVDERLNGEDGLGAIFPAMANAVMMYAALGYDEHDPNRATARNAVEKLLVVKEDEAYCQPCLSPVWDTALAAHALMETGVPAGEAAALRGLAWLKPLQVLDVAGDWAEDRPSVRPGGWAFQYRNDHYPDLDDTAVVAMVMDRARHRAETGGAYDQAIERGREWVEGMQSANGGWGAFDADNTYHYLNNIPFADHGALLDPPTVDVAARCVSMLAQLGEASDSPRMRAALAYLEREQEADGSWFGRWGVNYVYGTWSALCALNAAGVEPADPMVGRAVNWLVAIQNPDGGWGESCDSYRLDYSGYEPAPSASSQTAWALLGLMAAGECDSAAVARGVAWLTARQKRGRRVARRHLYRRRVSARLLPALPRLFEVLPPLGAGPLPKSPTRQYPTGRVWDVGQMPLALVVVVGMVREARIVSGQGPDGPDRRRPVGQTFWRHRGRDRLGRRGRRQFRTVWSAQSRVRRRRRPRRLRRPGVAGPICARRSRRPTPAKCSAAMKSSQPQKTKQDCFANPARTRSTWNHIS